MLIKTRSRQHHVAENVFSVAEWYMCTSYGADLLLGVICLQDLSSVDSELKYSPKNV